MDSDFQTNFGWWTDKPDRKSQLQRLERENWARRDLRRANERVVMRGVLVVALMFVFIWSIKSLAGW